MPSDGYENPDNPNQGSGSGSGTDWGGLIDDVGGLFDGLFDGGFWDSISSLGCLSSSYKLKYLETNLPSQIDQMRSLSGVDSSMLESNVNEFVKRLFHYLTVCALNSDGDSCKHKYFKKAGEIISTYYDGLKQLLQNAGFVADRSELFVSFSQPDVDGGDWGFIDSVTGVTIIWKNTGSGSYGGSSGNYGTIGGGVFQGGNIFGGGQSYLPTLNNVNLFNWALGAGLAFMGFVWLRDSGNLKEFGINKKRK